MMKKVVILVLWLVMIPSSMASSTGLTTRIVDLLKRQNVHVVADGENVSLYIPVKQLFVDGSTNLTGNPGLLSQVRGLVNRYHPRFVSVVGHLPPNQSPDDQDLLSTQTRLFMKALSLKAPGRVVMSGLEEVAVNSNLAFWKAFNYPTSIEVRWKINLDVDYKVLDA